jgi:hypothetical protein
VQCFVALRHVAEMPEFDKFYQPKASIYIDCGIVALCNSAREIQISNVTLCLQVTNNIVAGGLML